MKKKYWHNVVTINSEETNYNKFIRYFTERRIKILEQEIKTLKGALSDLSRKEEKVNKKANQTIFTWTPRK